MGINILEARRRVMMEQPHIETLVGNPVSFKAEALPLQELKVGITPVQDLHGQDAPYPPGGGKNLLPNTATTDTINDVKFTVNSDGTVSTSGTASDVAVFIIGEIAVKNGTEYKINGLPDTGSNTTYGFQLVRGSTVIGNYYTKNGTTITAEADETLVCRLVIRNGFNASGLTFSPMIRLNSIADGTYAPYSNICPISGHTGVNVSRTGRNLVDISTVALNKATKRTETKTFATAYYFKPGTYTFSVNVTKNTSDKQSTIRLYNGANPWVDINVPANTTGKRSASVTATEDVTCPKLYAFISSSATETAEVTFDEIMLEIGSTASTYEAYQGTVYPITWETAAGTVYGGTLDVVNGVLTVDRANISSYNGESLPSTWISDRDVYAQGTTPTTGAQVVYELATPTTFTLSAQQISSLLGMNNLWNDINGDNTVSFYTH